MLDDRERAVLLRMIEERKDYLQRRISKLRRLLGSAADDAVWFDKIAACNAEIQVLQNICGRLELSALDDDLAQPPVGGD